MNASCSWVDLFRSVQISLLRCEQALNVIHKLAQWLVEAESEAIAAVLTRHCDAESSYRQPGVRDTTTSPYV